MTREQMKNEFLAHHAAHQEKDDLRERVQLALWYINERGIREAFEENTLEARGTKWEN